MQVHERAEKIIQWLRVRVKEAEAGGLVVGLSGGIDSALTAALSKKVCPNTTFGVIMPCYSDPRDALDAQLVADTFDIPVEKIVLDDIFESFVRTLTGDSYDPDKKDITIANIKPRLRMTTLYFFAARRKSLVVGTSNKSEITVGYYTKYGDGGVDLLPIGNLVKTEVWEMAKHLGVPDKIIQRRPTAGLWADQNDEVEMGVTYEELDRCILYGDCSLGARDIIEGLSRRSEHKKMMPLLPPF